MASSAAGPFEGGYKEARQIRIPRAFQLFQKHFGRWLLLHIVICFVVVHCACPARWCCSTCSPNEGSCVSCSGPQTWSCCHPTSGTSALCG